MAELVYLHGQPAAVGHYVRVGTTGHRQLETLLGSGRMPMERVVIEACAANRQADLMASLHESGRELILDTNVAELSALGRFQGMVREAPWADPEHMLTPSHFAAGSNQYDVIGKIARFAVQHRFQAVLAPTHVLLEGSIDSWLRVDHDACLALRRALDIEGGRQIAIDYTLSTTNTALRDPAQRRAFIAMLEDLPFDNLWLRISGFGAHASAMGVRRYIASVMDFHRLNRPIVADGVGGIAAMAIAAFGAAGGICHGVAEKERFDASGWNKPRSGGGGGSEPRILVPGIDRLLKLSETKTLMAATGARRLLSCNDRACCPHGLEDTIKNPKAHYLHQRSRQISELSGVPEKRRARHFLDTDLAEADRTARKAAKLKIGDDGLAEILARSSERLDKMRAVLEDLHRTIGEEASRSATPVRRPASAEDAAARRG